MSFIDIFLYLLIKWSIYQESSNLNELCDDKQPNADTNVEKCTDQIHTLDGVDGNDMNLVNIFLISLIIIFSLIHVTIYLLGM